ncbi:MAG: uroporphyrinogen decarboxylase [Candidatus Adiutrix sp.]|nr:uroporphyrinogen decarboxylase [Candidatus Adiutrix sp.]
MSDLKKLYEQRLARYQAAIALEPVDRVPLGTGSSYFAEIYAGNTKQEVVYDLEKWLASEIKFCQDFPAVDVLRDNRIYAPLFDALGNRNYKIPGRDLKPDTQFQFVEKDYMKADEYDELIDHPVAFMVNKICPRIHGELDGEYSLRKANAILKAGLAQAALGGHMRRRTQVLAEQCGMPQPMAGCFLAPFDALSDSLRDMKGVMMDMRRQPDKVLAACDKLADEMICLALNTADPLKRWPIFNPTHKAMFLSPKEFDYFYWPSFKKVYDALIESGQKIRCYLEGTWEAHAHHFREFPKGSVLCDVDNQSDVFKVKEIIGGHQCLAGGLQDSLMILGSPEQVRERVRHLCQIIGREPGFILSGGCNFPYDTKPENFKALCEAVEEYGWLDRNLALSPKAAAPGGGRPAPRQITPWEVKKAEIQPILGNEDLIKNNWNALENQAYAFWWQWVL